MDKTKTGVLRYLGHRGHDLPGSISSLVDECLEMMQSACAPRHVTRRFDVRIEPGKVHICGTELVFHGNDISRHISGCEQAVLMASTLGAGADALIRSWERADLTRSLILDACATQLIEETCDEIERNICSEASQNGLMATRRYSPGYGDFPLLAQPDILAVLDAGRKIGLTCTDSLILLPRKSVTAVIGLGKNIAKTHASCESCNMRGSCKLRKDEDDNGCPRMD